jgi:hypothetical protein
MKARSVKTKIKQLVKHYGGHKKVAEILNIELSYIYKLEKDAIPGWHLYQDICNKELF